MKFSHLLVAAAAVLAGTACNGEKGGQGGGTASTAAQAVKPPPGGDWSQVVTQTGAGGFLMGNPNATVKLVEFGSMTCPHCREFDETGVQPLIDKYVKTGRVAYEFRNFVMNGFDLAGSLIARCNGAASFFPLTRAMYKDQPNWMAKLQAVPPEQQQALQNLPPQQQFVEFAKLAGFQQWAAMRGVPTVKSNACLSNDQEVSRLVQMTSDATSQYNVEGTPSFVLNDEPLGRTVATWDTLEPKIRDALGG